MKAGGGGHGRAVRADETAHVLSEMSEQVFETCLLDSRLDSRLEHLISMKTCVCVCVCAAPQASV